MATAKTVIKKSTRRRGTVSLTKVRKIVNAVYDQYTASNSERRKIHVKKTG